VTSRKPSHPRLGVAIPTSSIRSWAAAIMFGVGLYVLWGRVDSIYSEPPIWVPLMAFAVLILIPRRLPSVLVAFWLFGQLTLIWSLGPGNTMVAILWESLLVAAFAVGAVPGAVAAVIGVAILDGFQDVVAL